ncbi:hypothetical protein BLOT_003825 [Blomia tropicalis]|nr:hypothetical protein BLOT_003825 [Blomia tropicalis]
MDEETRVKRRSNSACNRCHSEHDELGFESSRLHVISDSLSSPCLIDQLSSVPPPSSSSSPSHRHEETSESQLVEHNSRHSFTLQRQDEFEDIHFVEYGPTLSNGKCTTDHFVSTNDQDEENDPFKNAFVTNFKSRGSLSIANNDMAPHETGESNYLYSTHKKLTRLINRDLVPIQASTENGNKFETQVMISGDMQTQIVLQPKSTTTQPQVRSPHCSKANDAFLYNRGANQEAPFHYDYDYPTNVFNTLFGSSSKAQNWFNGILGCLKPFWTIIGTKESPGRMYDEWEIPFEQLKNLEFMGSGAQGAVFKGRFNNEWVAVKKVKEKRETDIRHLRRLSHPNIVAFRGVCTQSPNCYCIVMEFCPYGQLYDLLKDGQQIPPLMIIEWAREIASGMNYLHLHKIIHRDLKSPNVLISNNYTLKISDFGTCKQWNDRSTKMSFAGTVAWMAPEIIRNELCSEKVDIWSFGVVLWELLNCEIPYRDVDSSAIIWGVGSSSLTLPIPSTYPRGFHRILQQCWNSKPRSRPSFRQILADLEMAAAELEDLEPNYFFTIQQQWREEISNSMKRMKRRRSCVASNYEPPPREEHQKDEVENLVSKRKDELLHAQHIREEYERKRECANNLYMELMTCLLKLEQREKELIQRETDFARKVGHQRQLCHSSSIISPFVEKVPQVFQRNIDEGNQMIPYSVLCSRLPEQDSDLDHESETEFESPYMRRRQLRQRISAERGSKTSQRYGTKKLACNCSAECSRRSIRRKRTTGTSTNRSPSIGSSPARSITPDSASVHSNNARSTPRPSALINDFDRPRPTFRMRVVEQSTQTEKHRCNTNRNANSDSSSQMESNNVRQHIDKSTSTSSLDLLSNLNSPNYGHSRLVPKMSTTSTFDSGYGDGYQSSLSTPSTHSMRIRFPDKSPMTPISAKAFENEFDIEQEYSPNGSSVKVSVCRIKCRQTNSNTLPSLSSIDENGTTEELTEKKTEKKKIIITEELKKEPEKDRPSHNEIDSRSKEMEFKDRPIEHYHSNSDLSSFYDSSLESVQSSDDDDQHDEESKYLLSDRFRKAVHHFNQSSRRYCDSMSSSDNENIDNMANSSHLVIQCTDTMPNDNSPSIDKKQIDQLPIM